MPQPSPLLYDHPVSNYAQKVRIALREKGVLFIAETPLGLGGSSADRDLLKANPRAEIPVMVVSNDSEHTVATRADP